jgi:hypothetical protein
MRIEVKKTSSALCIMAGFGNREFNLLILLPPSYIVSCFLCNISVNIDYPLYVVLTHHGMERPGVADGGDGFPIRRVAANILNKQSRTCDKELSSTLRFGRGANKSLTQETICYKLSHRVSDLNGLFEKTSSSKKWIRDLENRMLVASTGQVS